MTSTEPLPRSAVAEDAAAAIVRHYAPRLHALVARRCSNNLARVLDPEDILQSVFRRFFEQVSDPAYQIPAGDELWLLLLTIALNRVRSAETHHRAARRDLRRTGVPLGDAVSDEPSAEERLVAAETLERLSPRYRAVVQLRLAGHSVAEIATRLGRSLRTVERLFEELRTRLGELLHD